MWLRLESQFWWLWTRLDNIIKDLQLDLDFDISDSGLDSDFSLMTWKYLKFSVRLLNKMCSHSKYSTKWLIFVISSKTIFFPTGSAPLNASINIQSGLRRTNKEGLDYTVTSLSARLQECGNNPAMRNHATEDNFICIHKVRCHKQKMNCRLQNLQRENNRRRGDNIELCSAPEAAQRKVSWSGTCCEILLGNFSIAFIICDN